MVQYFDHEREDYTVIDESDILTIRVCPSAVKSRVHCDVLGVIARAKQLCPLRYHVKCRPLSCERPFTVTRTRRV